jgi:hypothetical protein
LRTISATCASMTLFGSLVATDHSEITVVRMW